MTVRIDCYGNIILAQCWSKKCGKCDGCRTQTQDGIPK